MTEGAATGPVATFCAELRELQRGSGRSPSGLARDLSISRGQLYAILNGEIKRPPDFSGVVEPLVRACGADDAAVAEWRRKHDVLDQVAEQLRRQRRLAGRKAAGDSGLAAEIAPGSPPAPAPAPAPEYGRPRRLWLIGLGAAVALIVLGSVAGAIVTHYLDGSQPVAAGPCPATEPGADGDLLSVPHAPAGDDPHLEAWWRNDGRVGSLVYDKRSFTATVKGGSEKDSDLLILHSCNPVQAGRSYTLTFTASATVPETVTVHVQDNRPPEYRASLDAEVRLTGTARRWTLPFTGEISNPASELAFLVGGHPAEFQIHVTGVTLMLNG
jgi:hypothetical protein